MYYVMLCTTIKWLSMKQKIYQCQKEWLTKPHKKIKNKMIVWNFKVKGDLPTNLIKKNSVALGPCD